jgi:undecaprenyl-diphosphatase
MIVVGIVIGAGVAAAVAAFVASASKKVEVDPVDPTVAEHAVERTIRRHPRVRRFLEQRLDRESAGGFLLTAGFTIVFATSLALGALFALADRNGAIRAMDRRVSEWGSANADSRAVDIVELVTHLGSSRVVFVAIVVAAVADYTRRRNHEVFMFMAAVQLGELLLNNLLKVTVRRERPAVLQLIDADGFAFPSGHAAAAAAGWSAVALVLGRDRPRIVRAALAGAAALIAVTVATSRALLGVHWVSDVVAGLVLGWSWFFLVAIVFGGRAQRLGDPVAEADHDPFSPARARPRRGTDRGMSDARRVAEPTSGGSS